ncbi:MAG: response regulator transcription factor [Actinobacteria bacterium]|nr:response regulator transcription factor [Actinomycetota bacterium]
MSDRMLVLICAAEVKDLRAFQVILREQGHESAAAADAGEAISAGAALRPSAAIIQIDGAGSDGVGLTRRLRAADGSLPILVVCGEDDAERGIEALEAGADQMCSGPPGPSELVARLEALLRRARDSVRASRPLTAGDLEIDVAGRVVRQREQLLRLTPIEFELLVFLVERRGETVARRTLLVDIWGRDRGADDRLLRSHIFNLRRKLEPAGGSRYIQTEPGIGYRFGS